MGDAAGLAHLVRSGARIILTADDDCYMALNLERRLVADNGQATGQGFALALDAMAGGLAGKPVLVLGCGPVGRAAARVLMEIGARVTVYDLDQELAQSFCFSNGLHMARGLESALLEHDYLVEATTAADLIQARHLGPKSMVAAPGVPCGVEAEAWQEHQNAHHP
jgi:pyrrolysine biosynthesis protein PylD